MDARESRRACGLKLVFTQKPLPHTEKIHPHTICPPTWGFYGETSENEQQQTPGHPTKTNAKQHFSENPHAPVHARFVRQNSENKEANAAS